MRRLVQSFRLPRQLDRRAVPPRRDPRTGPGERIYAIGDVHGRADLLAASFDRIDRHRAEHPAAASYEILLGDYLDRGPDARGVVDLILRRRDARPLVALLGNHEDMLLDVLTDPAALPFWLENGGWDTWLSYGLRLSPDDVKAMTPAEAQAELARDVPPEHVAFLRGLPLHAVSGDYLFVHAGVRPGVPLARQSRQDLLWIREPFLRSEAEFGHVVVHGHSPVMQPEIGRTRINIDTGAFVTGRLTCLVLEDDRQSVLPA